MPKNDTSFRGLVLKREAFNIYIMGVSLTIDFDHNLCDWGNGNGLADRDKATAYLDPDLPDNPLLSAACHEVLEVLNHKMEWGLSHPTLNQLDLLITSLLEVG